MPLYEYRCTSCGYSFEKIQSFSAEPEKVCPKCQGELIRPVTAPALRFAGAGWYVNDYAGKGGAKSGESSAAQSGSSSDASKPPETKSSETKSSETKSSETKSADTTASTPAAAPAKPATSAATNSSGS